MIFRQLFDATSSTYSYLLGDEPSRKAVIIDPVFEQHERDAALIRELGLSLEYSLETHVHADHVTGAWLFKSRLKSRIGSSKRGGAAGVDLSIDHGDVVRFGASSLEVRATPGHTAGCVTYVGSDKRIAFTGDALLIRGAGRTDFQQGSAAQLFRSLTEQIFTLPDECLLYPGHDYAGRTCTTVAEERAYNPRVGGGANERDFVGYMENLALPHPKQIDVAVPANLKSGRPDSEPAPPVAWGPAVLTYAGVLEIDPMWVAEHRDKVALVDVREADELASEGGVKGALHVPLGKLRERCAELPKDRPIVTICRSGRRSAQATVILKQGGVTGSANLAGGLLRWDALGLPLQR